MDWHEEAEPVQPGEAESGEVELRSVSERERKP